MDEIDIEAVLTFNDLQLLKEYKKISEKLVELKNDELRFISKNPNRDFWTDDQDEDYSEILKEINSYEKDFYTLNKIIEKRV